MADSNVSGSAGSRPGFQYGAAVPTPASAQPKPAAPNTSSTSRYIPQFSAATQMIVNRIKKSQNTPGPSQSAGATSPQLSIKPEFSPSSYEDARKKVIMGMNTMGSTTLHMPAPAPRAIPQPLAPRTLSMPTPTPFNYRSSTPMISQPQVSTPTQHVPAIQTNRFDARGKIASGAKGMSAIRRVTMGLTASGRPVVPTPTQPPKATPAPEPKEKKTKPPPYTGPKRKPGRPRKNQNQKETADNSQSDASDVSDTETPTASDKAATPTTTTKSGRQILKPTTYNPAAMDSAGKKRQYSKVRTTEQALCKLCTRMASPDWNQIVFCDGCNDGWHQQCHTPWIPSEVIGDSKPWYCMHCAAKRDHPPASGKKQRVIAPAQTPVAVVVPAKVSWAFRPVEQKRTYLSTLPREELVALIMGVLEIHPDLPIFPGERTVMTPAKKSALVTLPIPTPQEKQQDEDGGEEEDELTKAWPKAGAGPFSTQLAAFMAANKDSQDDFRAISHTVYREGQKVWENGIAV